MKLCRATQDGRVIVESYDKTWSTGEGNGKPLHYSCLENPMNSMKKLGSHLPYKRPPRWLTGKEFTCQSWRWRSHGLIPGSGRSPRRGNGNTVQYPCLENPMDRRAWHAMVHGVAKSWTWLSNWMCVHYLTIMHSDAHFFPVWFSIHMFHFTKIKRF